MTRTPSVVREPAIQVVSDEDKLEVTLKSAFSSLSDEVEGDVVVTVSLDTSSADKSGTVLLRST